MPDVTGRPDSNPDSRTIVYTDGACSGNPGPGGWAWVVPDGPRASGGDPATTNQRMELTAALEAIRSLERPLVIVSDSTYLVNCFRDGWWKGWLSRNWLNSQKKPVANRDLWEPIIRAHQEGGITFQWVKGHSGDRWNDEADRLAVAEVEKLAGGIQPGGGTATAVDGLPPGHRLWVGGHRPQDLGGFGDNTIAGGVSRDLIRILEAKAEMHPDIVVVTGLSLGAETMGAEAAAAVGIPYAVVLAYPDFDSQWPDGTRRRFRELVNGSASVTVRQRRAPATRGEAAAAMTRRDGWVRQLVQEAVLVWDGGSGPVQRSVDAFRQSLGEENVWVLEPA